MAARILVVDDEKLIRWSLRERLSAEGYVVMEAADAAGAREMLAGHPFDAALFDLRLPDGNGLELIETAHKLQPALTVIVITAYSAIETAVQAIKAGAYDYIAKPFNLDALVLTVARALERNALKRAIDTSVTKEREQFSLAGIIGESDVMHQVKRTIARVASSDATVLLLGETGTGKDLAARAIHYESARRAKPFLNITCTAISPTLIESELFGHEAGAFTGAEKRKQGLLAAADDGTVFLDEIGDMPLDLQGKVLRFLEEQRFRPVGATEDIQVDCRLIAATNRNLDAAANEGAFREDLYYRIATVPITLPPLRERTGDVPLLTEHFLRRYAARLDRNDAGMSDEALEKLERYSWPGNVRELRNAIERAVLLAPEPLIEAEDIVLGRAQQANAPVFQLPPEGCDLDAVEGVLLRQALERTGSNQTHAAKLLGISRNQLRYKMDKHGL